MLSCQINISKENDSTPETPHYLEDFRSKLSKNIPIILNNIILSKLQHIIYYYII